MPLLIADKFEDSLQRLSAEEQKAAKLTVYELQTNPGSPGLNYEAVKRAKDKRFRSVRVTRDVRMIVHEMGDSVTVCFVAHHDDAYDWAARRRLEAHPKTGAAQLVEIRETVREVPVIVAVAGEPQPTPTEARASASVEPLFAKATDEELLSYGVPEDWLRDVRLAADEEALEALAEHLPAEATEALWELATGGTPVMPVHAAEGADPFAHPDAQRRFLLVEPRRSSSGRSTTRGSAGWCSCTQPSVSWSASRSTVPLESLAQPGQARPSSRFTARPTLRVSIRMRDFC